MLNFEDEISRTLPLGMPKLDTSKYGEAILYVCGCALLEDDQGDCYVYNAINHYTKQGVLISKRKTPITTKEIKKTVEKILKSGIAGAPRLEAERPRTASIKYTECRKILLAVFKELMPKYGYTIREEQIALADEVLQSYYSREVKLAEAEVGTGKTLAYLIAAILAKRGRLNDFWSHMSYPGMPCINMPNMPIVVATSSIALQKAIINDFIPELSRILLDNGVIKTPITSVLRKGREHYVCDRYLCSHINHEKDEGMRKILEGLLSPFAEIDLAETQGLTPHVKRQIRVPARCPKHCPHRETCRYLHFKKEAMNTKIDIQVTNHNYFLADVIHRTKEGMQPLLPNYQSVIIDEAHKFLSAARSMYGTRLSSKAAPLVLDYLDTMYFSTKTVKQALHITAKKLFDESKRLFREFSENISDDTDDDVERYCADIGRKATRHLRNISLIADKLYEQLMSESVDDRYAYRKSLLLWDINMIRERAATLAAHNDLICWLEQPASDTLTLCAIPKELNTRLFKDLWNKGIPIILTSGTLSAGNDFSHTKRTLGLDMLGNRISETSKPSPFNHKENALLYISDTMPFPDGKDKGYIAAVTDEVERLIKASHGHSVVLFTSYDTMGRVHTALSKRNLSFPLMRLERSSSAAIERFKQAKNAVLFASGALWEGIDIPGDTLSMLIIVRLPFQVPDPISEYEQTLYRDLFEYKSRVVVPEMLLKLKQGFGRLIRTETDTGCVAILDSRVNSHGAYRERVLNALPDCRVTADIADVEKFIRAKKPPEYFSNKSPNTPFPDSGKGDFLYGGKAS